MVVLLTGGLGYIGSNVCLRLEQQGISTIIVDNLLNSYLGVKHHLDNLIGRDIPLFQGNINDGHLMKKIFSIHKVDCVMHFAGMKSAPDSIIDPLSYYSNNLGAAVNFLETCITNDIKNFIFSSSATVYGDPTELPINETHQLLPLSPYASSKLMFENCLRDICLTDKNFNAVSLRYFNPVGADLSGYLGENPIGEPKNLAPSIISAALGKIDALNIYGDDYDTPDGTAIRDYVHVTDLADGHLKAYESIGSLPKYSVLNIGSGRGYSVKQVIDSFEKQIGSRVPVKYMPRRAGDVSACFADATKAHTFLGWKANLGLDDMCRSSWNSALMNIALT
jgi:UDP-glucose 4-epimerase